MVLSVNNLMETICNPAGRFKKLDGIYIETDNKGEPVFTFSGMSACFNVRWKHRRYVLKSFLRAQADLKMRLRKVAAYLPGITCPYLVEYVYLSEEMLVFNDAGESFYTDIVLMEIPEGKTLQERLTEFCDRNDSAALGKILKAFCEMSSWLISHDIVHNQITPLNIVVNDDYSIRLINYEYMEVPSDKPMEDRLDNDNIVVANVALGLKVLASDPSAFRALNGNSVFRLPVLRSSLLPMFADAAYKAGCVPMQAIVEMLVSCNYVLHRRSDLVKHLSALAMDDTRLQVDLSRIVPENPPSESHEESELIPERVCLKQDLTEYTWIGGTSESMICVEKDKLWGYLHIDGTVAIPLRYEWADDFAEGRAVVVKDGYYALIDKKGTEIIPAIYEFLTWDCVFGIAAVCYNGRYGVLNRDGEEQIPLIYEWMGDLNAPLIAVRKDGVCGYIYPNGDTAIDFRFSEVYDFFEGKAVVKETEAGEEFCLNEKGERVEAPDEELHSEGISFF